MDDFVGNVIESIPHIERMGGVARPMQSIGGSHPLTMLVTTAVDEQWQTFRSGVMSAPSADIVRAGLYVNISD